VEVRSDTVSYSPFTDSDEISDETWRVVRDCRRNRFACNGTVAETADRVSRAKCRGISPIFLLLLPNIVCFPMASVPEPELKTMIRVAVVGNKGKTAICNFLADGTLPGPYLPTVGPRIVELERQVSGSTVKVQLWEIGSDASQGAGYRANVLSHCHAVLFVVPAAEAAAAKQDLAYWASIAPPFSPATACILRHQMPSDEPEDLSGLPAQLAALPQILTSLDTDQHALTQAFDQVLAGVVAGRSSLLRQQ
jgi:hypothetical protein